MNNLNLDLNLPGFEKCNIQITLVAQNIQIQVTNDFYCKQHTVL